MKKIKYLREHNGYSLRGLAKKAGITAVTLHNIETGKRKPYSITLRAIAEALEVPVSSLFDDEEEEEKRLLKVS